MTRIEKAVKIVSDLYDFYRKIRKVPVRMPARDEQHQQAQRDASTWERVRESSESHSSRS